MSRTESKQDQDLPPAPLMVAEKSSLSGSRIKRGLFIALAILCLILGTIGIVVPGLPTVDFYILASFFAAKGSKRLHDWIRQNRFIAPILAEWKQHKRIPKKVKIFSLLSMTIAGVLMIYSIPHPWLVWPLIGIMVMVQIWMWTRA